MAFDQSKFLARFVEEAREHCLRISAGLLDLEHSSGDVETLNSLFRSAHTIKGSSRMMKLVAITELSHHMEDVLDAVRGGKVSLSASLADLLFRAVDALSAMLDTVAAGAQLPEAPKVLCGELSTAARTSDIQGDVSPPPHLMPPAVVLAPIEAVPVEVSEAVSAVSPIQESEPNAASSVTTADDTRPAKPTGKVRQMDYLRINAVKLDDVIRLMGEIVSEQGKFRRQVWRLHEIERATERFMVRLAESCRTQEGSVELAEAGAAIHQSLRLAMRSMSDTVIMQDHLVGDLRETSLSLSMLPLSTVFDTLRRTVRDLAREHGKDIDFVVNGGETELDRKIIERIGDPLIHMIRNSLDHGLENPEERKAAGKPAKGLLTLSAFYDGGCVTIALSDDGKGVSAERIRQKALSKRLYDADTLAHMSRSEITNLIFLPGFSTSPIITDLSGRGVGMDVVRKNIVDDLKGTIIIDTKEGHGTTFFLRLPLNLAVFQLFMVSVNGFVCALPATSIAKMLSVHKDEIIDIVHKQAIRVQEQIIPVESLAAILGRPCETEGHTDERLLVIVRDGSEMLGLMVDEILGREEMVVKPLPGHLQNLRLVSCVTIDEENSIVNVLHVPELFRLARELAAPAPTHAPAGESRATILVVDDSFNTREIEKSILEAYGYFVITASDGQEALEMARDQMYDLVITDVEMPRLDGFSLTERLRNDDRYRNIPIIIVTSREKDEDKKRGITVGADAYIVKGAFDQSNLLETVKNLIG
ncbi:MAG: hybrid sensor histidine kinase/response regulator [Oryzomonas sp.]|uniref:hybrid sensor histidine kinase/response regulator n=1 Tax=Oryzomonas sp. TaxID=2855186 RepID=UPI00284FF9E0|nr:hybrid sensor histidine kinase/response regulator [Oryzomonas sp.]MDR3580177.1 hybrid sensor histidine kinase/response regulator [Oryzomonas sp.]